MRSFTQLQFFQYHGLEVIRAENHFRKTMVDCVKDLLSEFFSEESKAWEHDQKQWEILQTKIKDDIDLDLSVEIKQLKETSSEQRRQLFKKICVILSTEELKKEFKTLNDYLQKTNDLLDKIEVGPLVWQNHYQDIDSKLRQVWVELKTFYAERLSVEKHLQNTLIEWMSQCLNTLPFWLPKNSYSEFHQIKTTIAAEQSLKKTIQQRKMLAEKIQSSLVSMIKQLKDDKGENLEISDSCFQLNQLLQNIQENLDTTRLKKSDWKQIYQTKHSELEIQRKKFFEQLSIISKKNLEAITLYDMKQDAFAQKYQLSPSGFCRAKDIQHLIRALEKLLLEPDSILHSVKPKPASVVDWLDKKDYADLLLLLSITSPEYLEACLEQKAVLYQEILENLQNHVKPLVDCWGGEHAQAVIRSYRMLGFYQRWQVTQKQTLDKLGIIEVNDEENEEASEFEEPENIVSTTLSTLAPLFEEVIWRQLKDLTEIIGDTDFTKVFILSCLLKDADVTSFWISYTFIIAASILFSWLINNDWTIIFTLSRLFTYQKKTFFTEACKNENAIRLFSELTSLVDHQSEFKDSQEILKFFNHEKQLIKTKLDKDKTLIMNKYHLWEKITAFCGLALTEQPTYKKAMIGHQVGLDSIDHIGTLHPEKTQAMYDRVDEWGNRFVPTWIQERPNPERDVKIIQNLTGLVCLLLEQGLASWMGYAYRFIVAINHVLFSQFDTWVNLATKVGFDEISLLSKEAAINWFLGLGIHLFLQDRGYWIPTFLSYTAATTVSFSSAIIIDFLIKDKIEEKEWNPNAVLMSKLLIQTGIYSKVYSSSLNRAVQFLQPTEGLTP